MCAKLYYNYGSCLQIIILFVLCVGTVWDSLPDYDTVYPLSSLPDYCMLSIIIEKVGKFIFIMSVLFYSKKTLITHTDTSIFNTFSKKKSLNFYTNLMLS